MHSDLPPTTLRGYYQIPGSGSGRSPALGSGGIGDVTQYLGPVIVAKSFDPTKAPNTNPINLNGNGAAVRLMFQNNLPTGAAGKLFLPVDPTLMGGAPGLSARSRIPTIGLLFTSMAATPHGSATVRPINGLRLPEKR